MDRRRVSESKYNGGYKDRSGSLGHGAQPLTAFEQWKPLSTNRCE